MPGYQTRAGELYIFGNNRVNSTRYSGVSCYRLSPMGQLWGPVRADMPVAIKDDVVACMEESYEGVLRTLDRWTGKVYFERMLDSYHSPTLAYDMVYTLCYDQHIYAFDYKTGAQRWRSSFPMSNYGSENSISVGDGLCSMGSYDGCIYVYDAFTGEFKSRNYVGDCPYEFYSSYYGTWPFQTTPVGADGKFYAMTGDHTRPWLPVPGETLMAIDGRTGKEMWRMPGSCISHGSQIAIADGILFMHDGMTGKIFAYSKGPSAVEVSVTKTQIAEGEYTWITGRITDQSAGQPGTPCVAKESMEAWMSYLHCSGLKPQFGEILGVSADLFATKSDGTIIQIGTVETDSEGYFKAIWTPPDEDLYTITCAFAGDESYWDSWGTTNLAVGPELSGVASMPLSPIGFTIIANVVLGVLVTGKLYRREEK
jgi:outer membrane protein assembly factor BamB